MALNGEQKDSFQQTCVNCNYHSNFSRYDNKGSITAYIYYMYSEFESLPQVTQKNPPWNWCGSVSVSMFKHCTQEVPLGLAFMSANNH